MLASWSREERIRVEEGGRERMRERLEKSWVVEGPITRGREEGISVLDWIGLVGGGGRRKGVWEARMRTDFVRLCIHE